MMEKLRYENIYKTYELMNQCPFWHHFDQRSSESVILPSFKGAMLGVNVCGKLYVSIDIK